MILLKKDMILTMFIFFKMNADLLNYIHNDVGNNDRLIAVDGYHLTF